MQADLLKLKKMHPGCPNKTFVSIFRGFAKSNPDIIFEGDFAGVLQESINELKKWFSADFLNVVDAQGVESTTVIVLVKTLHYVIRQYVDRKAVKDPKVAISQDALWVEFNFEFAPMILRKQAHTIFQFFLVGIW